MSDQALFLLLQKGDEGVQERIYLKYRKDFVGWMIKTHQCEQEEALELYQLAILVLIDNSTTGKLTSLSGSLKAYLFGIGKNKLYETRRKAIRIKQETENYLSSHVDWETVEDREGYEQKLDQLVAALDDLGDPCRNVLESYYYQNQSLRQIAEELDYKNANTVKNIKYKCLKRLQKLFELKWHNQSINNEINSGGQVST